MGDTGRQDGAGPKTSARSRRHSTGEAPQKEGQDAEKKDFQYNGNRVADRVNRFAYPLILAGTARRVGTQLATCYIRPVVAPCGCPIRIKL